MKTFTVTFHFGTNYGALLQTYALQQAILMKGHDNLVMEYGPSKLIPLSLRHPRQLLATLYRRFQGRLRRKKVQALKASFRRFHEEHLKLSRVYQHIDDLRRDPPLVDCLITGSDQVWNLHSRKSTIPTRFLDFGNASLRRFSFAASIEKLDYTPEEKDYVRRALANFRGISLREESARAYMEEITGRPCVQTADPVFLLTAQQWLSIARPSRFEGPYILCYQVQRHPLMQWALDELKRRTGWPVVAVCPTAMRYCRADHYLHDASPEEFLSLYAGASAVVTASFHGTAFALLFGKPVYSLARDGFASRQMDLMHAFGLDAYVIRSKGSLPGISTDAVQRQEKLAAIRKDAHQYLERMLNDEE